MAYAEETRWQGVPLRPAAGRKPSPAAVHPPRRPLAPKPGVREAAPELDCLRASLDPATLLHAQRRAARVGVSADQVLIAAGVLDEETYLRALARALGVPFEPLTGRQRAEVPITDDVLPSAARYGLLPLMGQRGLDWVIAPRGGAARRLCDLIGKRPDLAARMRLTSAAGLRDFILREAPDTVGDHAEGRLRRLHPDMSAAPRPARRSLARRMRRHAISTALGLGIAVAPVPLFTLLGHVLAGWFLGFIALRLFASLIHHPSPKLAPRQDDGRLPVYTIIAALYRESSSVTGLIAAFEAFDYPREKLDIKLAVEEDDLTTRAAIAALMQEGRHGPIEVIVAPKHGPRTKPKALNAALFFARGTFTVIYDAEDRPEPDQLRKALDAFVEHGERTACVQASLCIDNGPDSWLTRMFSAEYAGQFDVFLPGFARLGLPLPLGGSSNHFRTDALRAAGGWDPYNVTEDADLGLRLARSGYRTATFESTTYEEAPSRFLPWLRQRTRWMKGWMQTWAVHMRAPRRLWRQIGARGFITLQLAVGGNVIAALIHPLFLAAMLAGLAARFNGDIGASMLDVVNGTMLATGYLASAVIGWLGLDQRRMLRSGWVLALIPLYWLMLSLAAWRALFQFMHAPYRWEKTDHGLARSSLRRELAARASMQAGK